MRIVDFSLPTGSLQDEVVQSLQAYKNNVAKPHVVCAQWLLESIRLQKPADESAFSGVHTSGSICSSSRLNSPACTREEQHDGPGVAADSNKVLSDNNGDTITDDCTTCEEHDNRDSGNGTNTSDEGSRTVQQILAEPSENEGNACSKRKSSVCKGKDRLSMASEALNESAVASSQQTHLAIFSPKFYIYFIVLYFNF